MRKKILFIILAGITFVYADQTSPANNTAPQNAAVAPAKQKAAEANKPTVGSRQAGSEQIFGQSATPPANQKPTANTNINPSEANNPTVGGRQAGSEQIFGQSATPPANQKPTVKTSAASGDANNPNVGGRQAGSEQIFGQSAVPIGNNPYSK